FAVRLVLLGLRLIRQGLARSRGLTAHGLSAHPVAAWGRLLGGALALLLALGAGVLGMQARSPSPQVDPFYTTPADVVDEPDVLLRSEPFTRDVPIAATAWRILYTTTNAHGAPATASALVLVPTSWRAVPRPVIAWAHGT